MVWSQWPWNSWRRHKAQKNTVDKASNQKMCVELMGMWSPSQRYGATHSETNWDNLVKPDITMLRELRYCQLPYLMVLIGYNPPCQAFNFVQNTWLDMCRHIALNLCSCNIPSPKVFLEIRQIWCRSDKDQRRKCLPPAPLSRCPGVQVCFPTCFGLVFRLFASSQRILNPFMLRTQPWGWAVPKKFAAEKPLFRPQPWIIPKKFQKISKEVPKKFQKKSKEVPKKFQKSSKKVPKKFQKSSKKVPKKLQKSSKKFKKNFQKNSKFLVRSCLLIKCLKGHRSLGSFFVCQK